MMGLNIEQVNFQAQLGTRSYRDFGRAECALCARGLPSFAMMEKGRIVAEGETSKLIDDLVRKHMTV